ncbi:MAG: hypothetical protein Q8P12_00390, partial [bacterium]|nr:hypothetical protein [bacterium]
MGTNFKLRTASKPVRETLAAYEALRRLGFIPDEIYIIQYDDAFSTAIIREGRLLFSIISPSFEADEAEYMQEEMRVAMHALSTLPSDEV